MKIRYKLKIASVVLIIFGFAVNEAWGQTPATRNNSTLSLQQEFFTDKNDLKYEEEIEHTALPEIIVSSVNEAYPDHVIYKVYQARDGSYKIKLQNGEGKVILYYSLTSKLLKIENGKDKW
jgi:hypothetical protein